MRFTKLALPAFLGLPLISAKPLAERSDAEVLQNLNDQALSALQSEYNTTSAKRSSSCNLLNARVRRDW